MTLDAVEPGCDAPAVDDLVLQALGLSARQRLLTPATLEHCGVVIREAAELGRSIAWTGGGALWRDRFDADDVLSLARLNQVSVDAQTGLVRAQGGATIAAVEGALQRQGWTLDVSLPASLRLAEALATPPFHEPLRRRLMGLTWVRSDGALCMRDTSALRIDPGLRGDRALPMAREGGAVVEVQLRARPAHGARVRQCWTSSSAEQLIDLAERAVRAGWPHTRATLEAGHHVELGLGEGALRPVLMAATAAARTRLGGGGRSRPPRVVLELEVRAEAGVAEVWLAQLAADVGLPKVDALDGARWRADLARALRAWHLVPTDHWTALDGPACRAAVEEPGPGSALRCTHAALDGHGQWLVQTTSFTDKPVATNHLHPPLRRQRAQRPPTQPTAPCVPTDLVQAVRSWRRSAKDAVLEVSLGALTDLASTPSGALRVEVCVPLAEIERNLGALGRTLGLADWAEADVRLLDLLLDTPQWRTLAAAAANHGARFDAVGGVDAVYGVDQAGRAGRLTRLLRSDGRPGLASVPTHAIVTGWPLVPTATDWTWAGPWRVAVQRAHQLSVATPHLLKLAVAWPGPRDPNGSEAPSAGQATLRVRTGGGHPGALRSVDHVRRLLPGAVAAPAMPWPQVKGTLTAAGADLDLPHEAAPLSAPAANTTTRTRPHQRAATADTGLGGDDVVSSLWVSRFARGRAVALTELTAGATGASRRTQEAERPTDKVTLWP